MDHFTSVWNSIPNDIRHAPSLSLLLEDVLVSFSFQNQVFILTIVHMCSLAMLLIFFTSS